MNSDTGAIRGFTPEEIAAALHKELGYDLPLNNEDLAFLKSIAPQDRVAWAKQRIAERHEPEPRKSTFMPGPRARFKRRARR